MKKNEMIMYELDDCFGNLWHKCSKYVHLYLAWPVAEGKFDLIPFSVAGSILKEHGGFVKTREDIRNKGLGADFYYYIEPVEETKELRDCLKFSKVIFNLDKDDKYDLISRYYFVLNSITKLLNIKEIYKVRALGINLPDKSKEKTQSFDVQKTISVSDISKIRQAGLESKLLSENNLYVYRQQGKMLIESSLEEVLGNEELLEEPYLYYEYDPITEKNHYGDRVEFEAVSIDECGNKIYKESQKILQNETDGEYFLRLVYSGKDIRTFLAIPFGPKREEILKQIYADGNESNLKTFKQVEVPNGKSKKFNYFVEEEITKNLEKPKKLELS